MNVLRLDHRDKTGPMEKNMSIGYHGKCNDVTGKQGVRVTRLNVGSVSR